MVCFKKLKANRLRVSYLAKTASFSSLTKKKTEARLHTLQSYFVIRWFAWGEHKSAWLDGKHESKVARQSQTSYMGTFLPTESTACGWIRVKVSTQVHPNLTEAFFFLLSLQSVWDSGSMFKDNTASKTSRQLSPQKFLSFFFCLQSCWETCCSALRDRRELNSTRIEQISLDLCQHLRRL